MSHRANRTNAHHEPGSRGGEYTNEVVQDRYGLQVEGAVFGVGGVATD